MIKPYVVVAPHSVRADGISPSRAVLADPWHLAGGDIGYGLKAASTSVIINRWLSRRDGMFGAMAVYDRSRGWVPYCTTLEDPWLGNSPEVSCIPSGLYICRRWRGVKYPNTFEVTNVPGRSAILFHGGNTHMDTKGCILLGSSYGIVNNLPAVTASQVVFRAFMQSMEGLNEFTLEVRDLWGGSTQLVA